MIKLKMKRNQRKKKRLCIVKYPLMREGQNVKNPFIKKLEISLM